MYHRNTTFVKRREREGVEVVLKKEGKPAILLALPVAYVPAVLLEKKNM